MTLKERAVDLDLLKEVDDAIDKMASWQNELAPKNCVTADVLSTKIGQFSWARSLHQLACEREKN